MRNVLLLIACMLSFSLSAQKGYIKVPFFEPEYQLLLDSIINNNENKSFRSLVYLPKSGRNVLNLILVIKSGDSTKYWGIKDKRVLKSGSLSSDSIFEYKDYKKTGVIKHEVEEVELVQPVIRQVENSESVLYLDNKMKFYYEYGYISSYFPKYPKYDEKASCRKEWLEIIRRELKEIIQVNL